MRKPWTPAEDRRLLRMYATHSAVECAQALGRSLSSVQQRVTTLGLSKSAEWVAERTRQRWAEGRHENSRAGLAGGRGWNKGIKGSTGLHPACRATQFHNGRPASEARNYQPIGTLRVSKDGYLERKVTDDPSMHPARRWAAVHRLVWEAANGPVPQGHVVAFKPGRRTASLDVITLDAVELVTRAELMRRNTRHRFPKELADLIALRAALTRKINNRTRKREEAQPE